MFNWMLDTFGSYTPITFIDDEGISHAIHGMAGVDWSYVCSVVIFCTFVVCIFNLIRKLLGGR